MATTIALSPATDLSKQIAARAKGRNGATSIKTLMEGRSDVFKINPFDIEVEDGFNVRDFESPEVAEHVDGLALSISEVGVQRPLKVRNKGGKLILVDGECRLRAVVRAIEVYGAEINAIPVILADRAMSDADAALGILVDNSGLDVSPLGKSIVVKRLTAFGWSQADIAKKAGMSKARVIQLLDLAGLSTEVKGLISAGTVSATTALATARANNFDDDKTAAQIKEAATKVAASGKARVTSRALTGGSLKTTLAGIFGAEGVAETISDGEVDAVALTISADDWATVQKLLKLA